MKKKLFYISMALIMIFNTAFVFADDIQDKQKELKANDKKRKEIESQIKEINASTNKLSKELRTLDNEVDKASTELKTVSQELTNLNSELENTQATLSQTEESLKQKRAQFNKRLRSMYMKKDLGAVEVLLSSKDLKDLMKRMDIVKSISKQDKSIMEGIKEDISQIEEVKASLEDKQLQVEVKKKSIENKKQQLTSATRAKEKKIEELKLDKKELERQEDELEKKAKELEKIIVKLMSSKKYVGGEMKWPVPNNYRISSKFGMRFHPILKKNKLHTGIDIAAGSGKSVIAVNSGKVIHAGWLGGYGKVVMIDHGGKKVTLYAHNSSLKVKKGDTVTRGDVIAKVGSTGYSTGPHLHFEVRENGKYVDPVPYVKGK